MAYAYPIWNKVEACIYNSDKSYGAKETSKVNILVGSSKSNSYELAEAITTKRRYFDEDANEYRWKFRHSVDGVILKEIIFKDNKGKAGEFIKERSALKRMKGL